MAHERPSGGPASSAGALRPDGSHVGLPQRPWRPLVTLTAALTATLTAAAVLLGVVPLFVITGLGMLLLAGGWVLLLGLPSPRGTTAVLTGAAAILLGGGILSQEARESLLPGAVALALLVEFLHQLARRDGRPRLVESVSASVTGITVLTSGACLLLLSSTRGAMTATAVVMAAVATACVADLCLWRGSGGVLSALVSVVLGAAAAYVVGTLVEAPLAPWVAVLAGGLAGAASYAMRATQSVLPTLFGRRAQLASGVSSVFVTGVLAYALASPGSAPAMMALLAR